MYGRLRVAWTMILLFLAVLCAPVYAAWTVFEETSISSRISGSIRKGHILKTRSGHIYEVVDYVYLYEYEYSPDVLVLTEGDLYKLIIDGFDEPLLCKCHNCSPAGTSRRGAESLEQNTVKAIQASLVALGIDPGPMHGKYGARTQSALRRFQKETGLPPTGRPDPETLLTLATSLTERYPGNSDVLRVARHLLEQSRAASATPPSQQQHTTPLPTANVIESYITSEFDGLDYGNIYKLANGQIWEQTEPWIWVWVWVNPRVLIWNDGGVYRMKVEKIDHPVVVRRIK